VLAYATKAEWFCCRALVSVNQQKTKSRLQDAISEYTKHTSCDLKEHANAQVWKLMAEKLGVEKRPAEHDAAPSASGSASSAASLPAALPLKKTKTSLEPSE
jgi:NAD-dependent oxidoreductase involved in siderophore biosynthesis